MTAPTTPTTASTFGEEDLRALVGALDEASQLRRDQLAGLPDAEDDLVAAAQRTALLQTLSEITAAQHRHDQGRYGICIDCGRLISLARLQHRPWSATCIDCAGRRS